MYMINYIIQNTMYEIFFVINKNLHIYYQVNHLTMYQIYQRCKSVINEPYVILNFVYEKKF